MNTTETQPARGATQPAAILAVGVAAVSIALVSIVAFGGFGGRGGDGGTLVIPPSSSPSAPSQRPTAKPTVDPTAEPSTAPDPSPDPTADPSDGGQDAMPIKVQLRNVSGKNVYVDVVDYTGDIADAVSGTPAEGMSVDNDTIEVETVGPRSLKLTWIDFGIDNALTLYVYRSDGGYRLVLIQPKPTGPADAMGYDRELILTFAHPVSTGQVVADLQDGLDSPG
jgi:hypothetical protein